MRSLICPRFPEIASPLHSCPWRSSVIDPYIRKHPIAPSSGFCVRHKSTGFGHEASIDQTHLSHSEFNYEPDVDLSSLRRTLEAHRLANRARLVRKKDEYGKWESIVVPSSLQSEPNQTVEQHKHDPTHHLKITRTTEAYGSSQRDYVGKSCSLVTAWQIDSTTPRRWRYPWLANMSRPPATVYDQPAIDRLSDEIRAFDKYLKPSQEEEIAADRAVADIRQAVLDVQPGLDVRLIGSRATSLARPMSDIDFNIDKAPAENGVDAKRETYDLLRSLHSKLRRSRQKRSSTIAQKVEVTMYVRRAKVPIIKGVHVPSGLEFEIQNTQSAYDSTESIRYFMNEFPTLQSLFGVIKQMLTIRGLCSGPMGGITSYPLLNMIIATLKLTQHKHGRLDVGRQFLAFLDMYSTIDFHDTAISIQPSTLLFEKSPDQYQYEAGGCLTKVEKIVSNSYGPHTEEMELENINDVPQTWSRKQQDQPFLMRLQDPADFTNNLGKTAHTIKHIQATVLSVTHQVKTAMHHWDQKIIDGTADRQALPSLLDFCIGADYREFDSSRKDLRRSSNQVWRKTQSRKEAGKSQIENLK